ncbi:hypothetical protein [Nonomuraea sp. NPDC049400]|uniref:hypothetical protein n=1 Tax=Nonomuraea sp. NPDC049400 TaxID=3364352 RepID=UPI0037924634
MSMPDFFSWASEVVPEPVHAEMVAASASNWASLGDLDALAVLEADHSRWARFLEHEVAACQEPGALDGGTHILFAARHAPA